MFSGNLPTEVPPNFCTTQPLWESDLKSRTELYDTAECCGDGEDIIMYVFCGNESLQPMENIIMMYDYILVLKNESMFTGPVSVEMTRSHVWIFVKIIQLPAV